MAYSILTEKYDAEGALMRDYLCDTVADLPQASKCIAGTTAYVVDEKKKYIVNCCAEWCEQPAEGGGGSSEGGSGGGDIDALIDGSITEITSGVESVRAYAFQECKSLNTVNFPNATSIGGYAFSGRNKITTVNFPNVTSISSYAFYLCDNLTTADFPNATSIGVSAFSSCYKLITTNFPNATSIKTKAFNQCDDLTTVNFPNVTSIGSSAFEGCSKLTTVDLGNATSIESIAFNKCYPLKTFILRSNTLCSLSSSSFNNCPHILGTVSETYNPEGLKDGYIYVPSALIEDYKVATNWSTYATQFRALEDYTVDGTTTGALDESKI